MFGGSKLLNRLLRRKVMVLSRFGFCVRQPSISVFTFACSVRSSLYGELPMPTPAALN
jgi:hypothetical protein